MKAIFKIPEKSVKIKMKDWKLNIYKEVEQYFDWENDIPVTTIKGKPIIIITNNMPEELHEQIDKLISEYCGISSIYEV